MLSAITPVRSLGALRLSSHRHALRRDRNASFEGLRVLQGGVATLKGDYLGVLSP